MSDSTTLLLCSLKSSKILPHIRRLVKVLYTGVADTMNAELTVCYEVVKARGHPNIKGVHKTTFEITKEPKVTPRGDCIIGVSADKAPVDFNEKFKSCLKDDNAILVIVLEANGIKETVVAHGHSQLLLADSKRLVVRKSTFIEPATVGIRASKSAAELKRELISILNNPDATLLVHLYVLRFS